MDPRQEDLNICGSSQPGSVGPPHLLHKLDPFLAAPIERPPSLPPPALDQRPLGQGRYVYCLELQRLLFSFSLGWAKAVWSRDLGVQNSMLVYAPMPIHQGLKV